MKRCVLLLLVGMLSLQTNWAGAAVHCPSDGGEDAFALVHGVAADAAHAHAHHGEGGGHDGHAAGSGLDCGAFQFVALEALSVPGPSLPRAAATPVDVEASRYKSHLPGGLDRPKWRPAA